MNDHRDYIENTHNDDFKSFSPKEIEQFGEDLNNPDTDIELKKKALGVLAHCGDLQSYNILKAYAAKPDLDKLMFAYTVNDTISGLNSDKRISFKLASVKGIRFVPEVVSIDVPVEAYTQKNVEIAVECLNLPENLNVKFFPSKVKLSFFVGVSEVDSIKIKDFSVAIDYDGIKESKQVSVPVRITSSPSYVRNLTISPPNVEFIFEYKNTKVQ